MFRVIALGAVLLSVAGCRKGKQEGASCADVGVNFLAVSDRELADAEKAGTVDDRTRASVETHVPAMRDSMVLQCKDAKWSAETRGCFAAATDDAAMMSCYETLSPEQRQLLEAGYTVTPRK